MDSPIVSASAVADVINPVSFSPIPLPRLAEIADTQAKEVWGDTVARGSPIPLAGPDGSTSLYVFPFARGATSFPDARALQEEIAEGELRCRTAYETTGRPEYPLDARFGSIYVSATAGTAPIQLVTSGFMGSLLTQAAYGATRARLTALASGSRSAVPPAQFAPAGMKCLPPTPKLEICGSIPRELPQPE